jgi:hypothetical protein
VVPAQGPRPTSSPPDPRRACLTSSRRPPSVGVLPECCLKHFQDDRRPLAGRPRRPGFRAVRLQRKAGPQDTGTWAGVFPFGGAGRECEGVMPSPISDIYAAKMIIRRKRVPWLTQAQGMAASPESPSVCRTERGTGGMEGPRTWTECGRNRKNLLENLQSAAVRGNACVKGVQPSGAGPHESP